ncbi:hypothetical protein [Brevundimonas sp.]|uniref:hypothetical protein n=1 Tax=Brevundimonas sp. TaxID=1871086 RepID=UPI002E1621DF|nr:hypothetical protein [Brevundimonas sp.]
MTDELDAGDREALDWIRDAFTREAIDEIYQAFIDAGRAPSEQALEAMSSIARSSHNEQRRYIAILAKRSGSSLLSNHLRDAD